MVISSNLKIVDLYLEILTKFDKNPVFKVANQSVRLWRHPGDCTNTFQKASYCSIKTLLVACSRNVQQCSDLLQAYLLVVSLWPMTMQITVLVENYQIMLQHSSLLMGTFKMYGNCAAIEGNALLCNSRASTRVDKSLILGTTVSSATCVDRLLPAYTAFSLLQPARKRQLPQVSS